MSEMIEQKTVKIRFGEQDRSAGQSTTTGQTKSIFPSEVMIVHRFLKLAFELGPKQKMIALRHLKTGGFLEESQCCSKHLNSRIGLRSDQPINEDRAMELTALLIEFVDAIEPMLAGTWENLSPQSKLPLPRHFSKCVRSFLTNRKMSDGIIVKELRYIGWFICSIVAAIARAGDNFAVRFSDSVSPSVISAIVDSERGGLLTRLLNGKKACCWQKYCELMDGTTQETISREVQQAVSEYVESFIRDTASAAAGIREKKPC